MLLSKPRTASRPRHIVAAPISWLLLLTAFAAWLYAHEGHAPLPTKGAQVDLAKGLVMLSPDARAGLDVQTGEVRLQALDERLLAPATLVAPWQRHAYVTSQLGGKVVAVHARLGQAVTPGQVLVEVQSLELENLQLELLTALNDTRLSKQNLEQLEAGAKVGATTEQRLAEARARHQEDRNAVDIARRKLLALGFADDAVPREGGAARPIKTLAIKSPIAGTVTSHAHVQVGQVVEPSDHLFEVVDLTTVWVQASVLEKDLARVAVGQELRLQVPGIAGSLSGKVEVKASALDAQTRQGIVWAELPNPDARLLPGMFGQVTFLLPQQQKRLVVPEAALVRDGAESYVFVEEGPGQYARQNVVIGRRAQGLVEILQGQLVPGDRVLTVGNAELATFFIQGTLRLSPQAEKNIGLRVEPVQRRPVATIARLSGTVELPPDRRAVVTSALAGTVRRIAVDRDQLVEKGDVIAEVGSLEFQNHQLDLLRNHLQAELQKQILARMQSAGDQAVNPRVLREVENAYRAALLRRDTASRKLETLGLAEQQIQEIVDRKRFVEALPVRAPIAGRVVRFQAVLGQVLKSDGPLVEIHDLSRPLIRGDAGERQLGVVQVGQRARLRFAADPALVAEGVVVRKGQVLGSGHKPGDRSLSVWIELQELPRIPLLDGMLARPTLVVAESAPKLAVPVEALLREGTRAFVFVRLSDGTFERRPVETGSSDDLVVEITQGLSEGETVAVQGVAELQTAYAALK